MPRCRNQAIEGRVSTEVSTMQYGEGMAEEGTWLTEPVFQGWNLRRRNGRQHIVTILYGRQNQG